MIIAYERYKLSAESNFVRSFAILAFKLGSTRPNVLLDDVSLLGEDGRVLLQALDYLYSRQIIIVINGKENIRPYYL